jgi:hypothetical protein
MILVRPRVSRWTSRSGAALLVVAAFFAALTAGPAQADVGPNPDPTTITEWAPCEPGTSGPGTGVTVVVDFNKLGNHDILVRCAPGPQGDGIGALQNAGLTIAGTNDYGLSFICRIQGLPPVDGPDGQPCQRAAPVNAYWSYWHARAGGAWSYASSGAGSYQPKVGEVEGWSFSTDDGTIAPRVIPPGAAPFSLPDPQGDIAVASARLRTWLLRYPLSVQGEEAPVGATISPSAVTSWAAGGESLAPLAPGLAGYHDPDAVARAIADGRPRSAILYRVQPEQLTRMGLALIAQNIDPTHLDSGQDLRAELLAEIQADGRVPTTVSADPYGGPDKVDGSSLIVQSRAIAFLALTGGVPVEVVNYLDGLAAPAAFAGASYDPTETAQVVELLATARANGTAGLDTAIEAGVDALLAAQNPDGSAGDVEALTSGFAPVSTTLPAALVSRALAVTGHAAAASLGRDWVTRFELTPENAFFNGTERPDVGALMPSEDLLREATIYGLKSPGWSAYYAQTTGVLALPALAADPAQVLRPVSVEGPAGPVAPGPSVSAPGPAAPDPAQPQSSAPVRLAFGRPGITPTAARLARTGVLRVPITAGSAGTVTVSITVNAAQAHALGLRKRSVGGAKASFAGPGTRTLTLRLTAPLREALRTTQRRVVLILTAHGPTGTARTTLGVSR